MFKSKYLIGLIGLIAVIILGALFISGRGDSGTPQATQEFTKMPEFAFEDYSGTLIRSSDFQGKPLVINSWAAWCPFCRKELPDFATIQEEFGDRVVIISIDRAESLAVSKKYTDELGVTDKLIFLLDPDDAFYRAIGGFSMPETIFVDADGNIRDHKRGTMGVEEIRERIQKIL